ncbi:hypothetical protein VNO80_28343 [Phaseolus coccineus]|uniref:Uncharacterized protein n=1 Tax=Phaseolus coccineus TaxID=3886 RepID=A0AAN9L9F5_PHACN
MQGNIALKEERNREIESGEEGFVQIHSHPSVKPTHTHFIVFQFSIPNSKLGLGLSMTVSSSFPSQSLIHRRCYSLCLAPRSRCCCCCS